MSGSEGGVSRRRTECVGSLRLTVLVEVEADGSKEALVEGFLHGASGKPEGVEVFANALQAQVAEAGALALLGLVDAHGHEGVEVVEVAAAPLGLVLHEETTVPVHLYLV